MSTRGDARERAEREAEEALETINKRTGRNMPQAIATGALLVAIIVLALVLSTDAFVVLIVVFMVLALWELRIDFATAGLRIPVVALWLCSAVMILSTYYSPDHLAALGATTSGSLVFVVIAASTRLNAGSRVSLVVARKLSHSAPVNAVDRHDIPRDGGTVRVGSDRLSNVAVSVLALLYVPFMASFIILSLTLGHPVAHAFLLVFLPALGDTGGLAFGASFGKHKLSPRISPKKSWEGLLGSAVFAAVGAVLIFLCSYDMATFRRTWWIAILLGMLVAVTGTFGDLCASMLKRDLGIKDMGHLLKGHGGVMDRVDSIVISAPFITAVLMAAGL